VARFSRPSVAATGPCWCPTRGVRQCVNLYDFCLAPNATTNTDVRFKEPPLNSERELVNLHVGSDSLENVMEEARILQLCALRSPLLKVSGMIRTRCEVTPRECEHVGS